MNIISEHQMSEAISALPGVRSFVLAPPGLDAALRISIAKPAKPAAGEASADPAAILYVLDGDNWFGTVAEAARMGTHLGEVAPTVVVGIGYAEEQGDYAFATRRRVYDFYRGPPRTSEVPGFGAMSFGGGEAFLAVLRDHVIPEVEQRVGAIDVSRRLLFGTSAGGHFAALALTLTPHIFAGYAMISPYFGDWPPPSDKLLIDDVAAMAPGSFAGQIRVFLSAGEREEEPGEPMSSGAIITNVFRMRAALARHGIATALSILPGESHISGIGAAVSRALRFLSPPTSSFNWQAALKSGDRN
jgi:predicted alpha/beta superfamily hydrolase